MERKSFDDVSNDFKSLEMLTWELDTNVVDYTYFFQDFVFMLITLKEYLKKLKLEKRNAEWISEATKYFEQFLELYDHRRKFETCSEKSLSPLCRSLQTFSETYKRFAVLSIGPFEYLRYLRDYVQDLDQVHLARKLAEPDEHLVEMMMDTLKTQMEKMKSFEERCSSNQKTNMWSFASIDIGDLEWLVEDLFYYVRVPPDHKPTDPKLIFRYTVFLQDFVMELLHWGIAHSENEDAAKKHDLAEYRDELRRLAETSRRYEESGEFLSKCDDLLNQLKEMQKNRAPPVDEWNLYLLYLDFLKNYAEKLVRVHRFLKNGDAQNKVIETLLGEIVEKMHRFELNCVSKDLGREEIAESLNELDILKNLLNVELEIPEEKNNRCIEMNV
ncbi:hypothetical protein AVEN_261808-1 [Araneus ventricosus]|uniref:Uncharacterized protein n=1 Tax=Araneus ventricosus TaxID=182803 RepID=A0A4Y2LZG9_ARAVE|nr:hypothetical protein AVEN_261808-1 [Araneus ventricosus]